MLIATQATSVEGTQKYFEQVLTRGDYYLGQEVGGQWHGKGAELLGLVVCHILILGYTVFSLDRASSIFICQSTPL